MRRKKEAVLAFECELPAPLPCLAEFISLDRAGSDDAAMIAVLSLCDLDATPPDGAMDVEQEDDPGTLHQIVRDFRQWFRVGIEGTISGIARAFRLAGCYDRGFKSFEASAGLGVFTHNLVVLVKMLGNSFRTIAPGCTIHPSYEHPHKVQPSQLNHSTAPPYRCPTERHCSIIQKHTFRTGN